MPKELFLLSSNKLLAAWCSVELGPAYTIKSISKESYKESFRAVKNKTCVLIDNAYKSEVNILAIYHYLYEEYHIPIIIILSGGRWNPTVRKTVFSKAKFISVYAPSGKLFDMVVEVTGGESKNRKENLKYTLQKETELEVRHELSKESILTYDIFSGNSPLMRKFRDQITKAANSNDTVLLLGESGSGKTYTAEYIHSHSSRNNYKIQRMNVAEIAQNLAESQLFGTEAGAYTGALEAEGLFAAADGSTLFLDEIGELPLLLQAKLLKVIETRTYRRVGSTMERSFNARLLFATNIDLKKHIAKHTFREDLFYRINVLTVKIPSLREHMEDIPHLANRFVAQRKKKLSPHAIEKLCAYKWPGNIRELNNVLSRACTFCPEDEIMPEDIVFS